MNVSSLSCTYQASFRDVIDDIYKSLFVRISIVWIVVIAMIIMQFTYASTLVMMGATVILTIGVGALTLYYYKNLLFEILLVINVFKYRFLGWEWWHKIECARDTQTDTLYLGALPLKRFHHVEKLREIGCKSIFSVLEKFELKTHTLCGKADLVGMMDVGNNVRIKVPDFSPVEINILETGVKWLHEQLQLYKTVYIHCKSGVGRSALVVCAYLVEYCSMDPEGARDYVANIRHDIFSDKSRQMDRLREYYDRRKKMIKSL